ncbi:MAG: type II toxin-antitoxin system Phd/YefM family antitoxin [Propionibacteriaceae bacterium]|jgi:antitoxin (DNA-binding transcriptional repressor) of toxin-antitoxin stability system|nr:type II toxin-antitoxin system Phd/YefM family antitoxin [Propionibacteriaceae bacterium]
MVILTTRELKQNPAAAIRRVLETSEPAQITAHGKPTGVIMVPQTPVRRIWVSGQALIQGVAPIPPEHTENWEAELNASRENDFGRDFDQR